MDYLPEPSGVFNPSVVHRDVAAMDDHDESQEEADEIRDTAEGVRKSKSKNVSQ